MRYRAEIDGLRAIAVSSVLIFHFFPKALPLGYLGVDLFFVISGFLISRNIIEEHRRSRFSFASFYIRRAKRILPAMLVVSAFTACAASFLLTAPDLTRFGQSLLSTISFVANIYFWRDGGYFGTSDDLKPLLHMWSLGVEEQFYLTFPLALFFLLKRNWRSGTIFAAIVVLSLASLFANIFLLRTGGEVPAFFLFPTRIWQFGFGALAAIIYVNSPSEHKPLGLALTSFAMMAGLVFVPKQLPPGFIITVAASYFLARRYVHVPLICQFFSNPLIRKIGLISFSLYLWHWPIISLIEYATISNPSFLHMAGGMIMTVVVSLISYRFIEQPFRKKVSNRAALTLLAPLALVSALFSLVILSTNGFPERESKLVTAISSAAQTHYRCNVADYMPYGRSRACLINRQADQPYDIALVGNSHAQMYVPPIQNLLLSAGQKVLLIPVNRCLPTIDINISDECLRIAQYNYNTFLSDKGIKTVIISLSWQQTIFRPGDERPLDDPKKLLLARSLLDLIATVKASGRDVYLVGPVATPGYDMPSVLSRQVKFGHIAEKDATDRLRTDRKKFDDEFGDAIALLKGTLGDRLLLPHEALCDSDYCYFGRGDLIYFSDSNHLSRAGALSLEPIFNLPIRGR